MSGKRKFDSPMRQERKDRELMKSIQLYKKNSPLPTQQEIAEADSERQIKHDTEVSLFEEYGLHDAAVKMFSKKPLTSGKIKKKKKKKTAKRRKRSSSSSRRRKKKRRRRTAK